VKTTSMRRLDEREVRRLVREELRALLARLADDVVYSTRAGCAPTGYARDAWRQIAHRIGVRRGRYWIVTAQQLAAHEQRQTTPAATPTTPANDDAAPWRPEQAAVAMGLRASR
jgi:hypothetical protein